MNPPVGISHPRNHRGYKGCSFNGGTPGSGEGSSQEPVAPPTLPAGIPVQECAKFPKAGPGTVPGVIRIPASWFPEKLTSRHVSSSWAIVVARAGLNPAD